MFQKPLLLLGRPRSFGSLVIVGSKIPVALVPFMSSLNKQIAKDEPESLSDRMVPATKMLGSLFLVHRNSAESKISNVNSYDDALNLTRVTVERNQ